MPAFNLKPCRIKNVALFGGRDPINLKQFMQQKCYACIMRTSSRPNVSTCEMKNRKCSLSITVKEKRESRQSPAILLIPELRHDLTEEALYGVCHVRFSSWPAETLQIWPLMRHKCMKQYFDLRHLWHIWVASVYLDLLKLTQ